LIKVSITVENGSQFISCLYNSKRRHRSVLYSFVQDLFDVSVQSISGVGSAHTACTSESLKEIFAFRLNYTVKLQIIDLYSASCVILCHYGEAKGLFTTHELN